ncbi:Uncharacterised protein [Chromobacterium violaceum]|uniref:LysM domain-containing protein n=1 Tax=Chromobacterium violaceum TaxID=536 RepID=A0A3S4JZC9_CHRVL|nr:Uncharacterised protein [Chromobacterium violaceum]
MNKAALLALCLSSHASWAGSGGDEATWQYTVQAGDTLWSFAAKHLSSPPMCRNCNSKTASPTPTG